jgi:hypothetical protein
MKFPCKTCLILAICYSNIKSVKISKCKLFEKFVDENIFKLATDPVKKDSGKLGFNWFLVTHPRRDDLMLGIYLLVHPDKIWIKRICEFAKVGDE